MQVVMLRPVCFKENQVVDVLLVLFDVIRKC